MGGPEMAPHPPQTLGAPRRSRGTPRYSDRLLASAVSQKFHPTLRTQGIALEGPAKWAGGAVPVTNEVLDAGRAKPVGCIARAGEGLAFQDTEPDFDLVQPRGMEWKELEPHTALLSGEPRADLWCRVNRQVVQDDDQAAVGVAATEGLEKFEELGPTPSPPPARHHAARPDVEAHQNREHAVAPVVLFLARRPDRTRWAPGMQTLENLHLGFLVHAHDVSAPGRPQIP